MMMRRWSLAALMLVLVAPSPADAVLTDDEPSNDTIATAAVQIVPTAAVTTDGGEFTLVPGDTDYVGIGSLAVGDIVTVSTTPLDDAAFTDPDTMIGVFTSGALRDCDGDDSINNELANPPGGLGSLCRLVIDSAGTWYVGVTGFTDPPFNGNHFESGVYQLLVTINAIVVPPTSTPTATPAATATATSTATPTASPTATSTATSTPTASPTATSTATSTPAASPTATSTATSTPTASPTATSTPTSTATSTPTATPTPMPTLHATACLSAGGNGALNAEWTTPANAQGSDESYASGKDAANQRLQDYDTFGFTLTDVPSGSAIVGVEMQVEGQTANAGDSFDISTQLVVGGAVCGNHENLIGCSGGCFAGTADTTERAGGSATTWGCTISDSDVRASNFGVDLDLVKQAGGGAATMFTDDICLTVSFVPEPGALLQLVSGGVGLALLQRRRNRRVRARSGS